MISCRHRRMMLLLRQVMMRATMTMTEQMTAPAPTDEKLLLNQTSRLAVQQRLQRDGGPEDEIVSSLARLVRMDASLVSLLELLDRLRYCFSCLELLLR
jgi:hypothetical protein